MKLLNQSLKHLSIYILIIVTVWAALFYVNMFNEIKSSTDEDLENYKRLIIRNAQTDPSILTKSNFDASFFTIRKINKQIALSAKDQYTDTVIFMQDADDKQPEPEPVRMLTTTFEINGNYYQLKVANSIVEEDDLIDELFWDVVWLYAILIASIILVNNMVLKKLWKPFYDFLNQLKSYHLGATQKLPEVKSDTKEFQDLQKAVNTLLQHSNLAFEQQKEFIGNASHELQTPLAIAISKLELLLEKSNLEQEQLEKIAEVFQIIERLVLLNKSLLLLSKIDNKQFFDNQNVQINPIVLQMVNELEDISSFKEIKISIIEKETLNVNIDATLANIIISNLLKNAIFHNIKNGSIEIEITKNTFKIFNTGKDEMLQSEKIFNRFQKSDSKTNGTGLGLAIVKAITDLYNFPIYYHFNNGKHSFEIHFSSKKF
ncbi:sensor histidine kinase [Flavobacterium seoulense]|uniref:histidine kinase n=1 Tax=Flavobacterium seoulense TaxID=1492738 RepID=A0A066WP20_9FLAO|nr:HAMP domain-containing sensor histidine kinase [Flavobacterium seoulense]KDN55611.1 histidine kinase [Flavobacterium seoulense]